MPLQPGQGLRDDLKDDILDRLGEPELGLSTLRVEGACCGWSKSAAPIGGILAMDLVGHSRQMASDETGTLARLKDVRKRAINPAVAEHGGCIVKKVGDGLLIEFASAVSAIECAA